MKKAQLYLRPLLMGLGGLILVFMAMMATPPVVTSLAASFLFLLLGYSLGQLQPASLWYAPLLLNIPLWLVFLPMGMEFLPPKIMIWYFLAPPVVALPMSYAGMYIGSRPTEREPKEEARMHDKEKRPEKAKPTTGMISRYFLPLSLGLVGMFICMAIMLFGFSLGIRFPIYILAYPLVFVSMGALLSINNRHWLATAALLCLIPLLYWVVLQPINNGIHFRGLSFDDMTTTMFVLMPLTFIITALAAFLVARRKVAL